MKNGQETADNMGKIFCLMGKSSTGKDTIYKKLMARPDMGLKRIVPYTTRPIRAGETEGVEYHFTDESGLWEIEREGRLIELRSYHTVQGIWKYFTVDDGQIRLELYDYLVIGTLEFYLKTRSYFGEKRLVPVLIELNDGERLQRALDRERVQENPDYEELCRRFLADAADFSEEMIERAGIGRRFVNHNSDECVREIAAYIMQEKRHGD